MDEIWEKAVETALNGQTDYATTRTLTLDGAVKAVPGRLPPPSLLEKFVNLQHLSVANNGVPSLERFPRLRNLRKLVLSDNRIAGGLEYLVGAGLESLRDLDLSNNRIQYIEDLAPLAQLKLVSLDLYECPVTRVKDYRSRVFGLIKSLKYLDKMDADENDRPDSDEEEDEEEEDEDDDEEDPGIEEIEGEDRRYKLNNGHSAGDEGVIEVNDEEESDADEEIETGRQINGNRNQANGFRVEEVRRNGYDDEEEESDSGEEVDDDDDDDDVVEVHEIEDSDDEDEEDEEEEEVDNDQGEFAEQGINGRLTSTAGEIDGHEQGEDAGDDDDIGETGEEEQGVDDGEFEDEEVGEEEDDDYGDGYLIQSGRQDDEHDAGGSDMDSGNEEEDDTDEEEVDNEDDIQVLPSSSHLKRKRGDDDED